MTAEMSLLANGIRVVTDTMKDVETVSLGMWVDTGSRSETKELNGISHVIEHMVSKGTKTRTAKQISEEIENIGGIMNAYTSHEETAYYVKVLKGDVELATDITADILLNPTFISEELEREKGVIIQEIGMHYDDPEDHAFNLLQQQAFKDQAIGWPVIGTAENIKSFTSASLKEFMSKQYFGSRMVFSAAGNISHEENVKLIEKYFGSVPKDGAPLPTNPARYIGGEIKQSRPIEQAQIILGFEGLSSKSDDYFVLGVLNTILGGGLSSRLHQEIREKRGLVYYTCSFNYAFDDTGLFGIYAGTGKESVPELIPVAINEVGKITKELVSDEEINRAKTQLKSHILMASESTSARCDKNARKTLLFGKPLSMADSVAKINAVTKDDVQKLANKIFRSKLTLSTLGAIEKTPSYEEITEALSVALV